MKFSRKSFFTGYREVFGRLDQPQVDGLEFLLGKVESDPEWQSIQDVSYFIATVAHETAWTFQPIKEYRAKAGTRLRKIQDRYWLSGFYGRGYVMITWKKNYEKFGIADDPDKALEPETSYEIASRGMREGMFTGLSLDDFINDHKTDYVNARKVVNGLDKAEQIAKVARQFEAILATAEQDAKVEIKEPEVIEPPKEEQAGTVPPTPAVEVKASEVPLWTRITSLSVPAGVTSAIGGVIVFAKELPPYAWIAFSVIVVAAMVIGYLIWKDGKKEAHERTKIVLNAAADRDKNDLRLV